MSLGLSLFPGLCPPPLVVPFPSPSHCLYWDIVLARG